MVADEIAGLSLQRHSAVNAEPVYVDVDAQHGLNDSDDQDDDIIPSLEEPQAQSPDDERRHEGEHNKAAEVVSVGDVASADRASGEVMAEEARDEERESEPGSGLICQKPIDPDGPILTMSSAA
jgi:hypothetical protein